MKKFLPVIALAAVLFLQGCKWDDPSYHKFAAFAIGEIRGEKSGSIYLMQDDSTTVLLKGLIAKSDSIFGSRFYADGMMYAKGYGENGYDMTLEVIYYIGVTEKELIFVENQNEIEEISTAGFEFKSNALSSIFQTGKYLNIPLAIYVDDLKKHSIDYALNEETIDFSKKEVTVYLCHNSGDDSNNNKVTPYGILSSLDLTSIFEHYENGEEIVIKLNYKDLGKTQQTLSLTVICKKLDR
ncbi:MAG: hypothetical protein LBS50_06105 [Prevotellaceae bacterium]|jgi:hypothetical protein|nr:hypothetical protein [Prevotellaceae bacterium]